MFIQTIHTQWTKRSRGAPYSTKRNATPEFLRLPTVKEQAPVVWHYCRYREPNFWLDEHVRLRDQNYKAFFGLEVEYQDNLIKGVMLRKRRLTIQPSESIAIIYNYRDLAFEDDHLQTRYHKVCINVSNSTVFDKDVFRQSFDQRIDLLRDLW